MTPAKSRALAVLALPILMAIASFPRASGAQNGHAHPAAPPEKPAADSAHMAGMADHAMSGPMDVNMTKHMQLTPVRTPTRDDSVRATKVADELRRGIAKYQDTALAVADGYKMFLPGLKNQHVYHFTNYGRAFKEVFRFDASEPSSLLYEREPNGKLRLIGAMYTVPNRASESRLNDRVPLGIARWHKHVNWCVPKKGDESRWTEQKGGKPLFGPESPIATKAECDAVKGDFHESIFGWMLHANVYAGHDLATVFGDVH